MNTNLRKKLCKTDPFYGFLRSLWAIPNHSRYYRHINVLHKENIPEKGPIIFAANHQNALMDAMAVLATQKHQVVFVARADIFKKPLVIKILHFLRILPIYRKRDGGNSFDNNQETFELVDSILKSGQCHGILPEGTFNPHRCLAPLQKGVFRTALKAQEKFGITGGVKIVPVGLNWQRPTEHFRDVTIVYGTPIIVADYYSLYMENPAKAYIEMQERLTCEMKKLIIDIQNVDFYDFINKYRELFANEYADNVGLKAKTPEELLTSQQLLVERLEKVVETHPEQVRMLEDELKDYQKDLHTIGIRNWLFRAPEASTLELVEDAVALIILSPLALIGAVLSAAPLALAEKLKNSIKDPQFLSSLRYVVSMCVRTLQNIILIPLIIVVFRHNIIAIAFCFLLLYYAERAMLFYVEFYKKFRGQLRFRKLMTQQPEFMENLCKKRQRLLSIIDSRNPL